MMPRPTLVRNLNFWLLAMLLGMGFLLLLPTLTGSGTNKNNYGFVIAGLATFLLLAVLIAQLLWALTVSSVGLRWPRVFMLQSLSLGDLVALGYVLAGGHGASARGPRWWAPSTLGWGY